MSIRDHLIAKRIRDKNGRETTVHVLPQDSERVSARLAPFTIVEQSGTVNTMSTPDGYLALMRAAAEEERSVGKRSDLVTRSVVEDHMHERTRMEDVDARPSILLSDARGLDEDQRIDREDAIDAFRDRLTLSGMGMVDPDAPSANYLLVGEGGGLSFFGAEESDSTEDLPRYRITEVVPTDRLPERSIEVIRSHVL